MRLIIIDDVKPSEIAEILNTRHECACVDEKTEYPNAQNKPDYSYLVGKRAQCDHEEGYIKGEIIAYDKEHQEVTIDCTDGMKRRCIHVNDITVLS